MDKVSLIQSAVEAIEKGDVNALKNIVSSIPKGKVSIVLSGHNRFGRTPLVQSVIEANISIVKFLLEDCHVDPVLKSEGDYQFHFVFRNAYDSECEIIKFLIESGVDINTFKDYRCSPLYMACRQKNLKMVRYLLEKGEDNIIDIINKSKCLTIAVDLEDTETINFLLECGAGVNVIDEYGRTPLYVCGSKGNLELFKILVGKGAIQCAKFTGLDQLQYAALHCHDGIFAFYSTISIHTRDEILDCLELQGIRLFVMNDIPSSIRTWKNVLKERSQVKESSFLENIQRKLHQSQDYDLWFEDQENSAMHSMIILERLFGLRTWVVEEYFEHFIETRISITNTEFWKGLLDFEL